MAVSFRVRTSAGQEVSFASHEMFEDFVRSGDLSPDDLVYDGETGSWSSARTHPIVLEIEYAREAAEEAADEAAALGASAASEQAPGSTDVPGDADVATGSSEEEAGGDDATAAALPTEDSGADNAFGLNLAPATEVSADEAKRAFVEKMEAEREADFDFAADSSVSGFSMEDSGTMADMLAPAPEPEPVTPSPRPSPGPPRRETAERGRRSSGRDDAGPESRGDKDERGIRSSTPRPAPRPGGGGVAKLVLAAVVVAVLGVGGYLGYQTFNAADAVAPDPAVPIEPIAVDPTPVEPEPEPEIASTESAVRERAQERFLTATQNALRDLPSVPDVWPQGGYLAVPSDYPEVLQVWETYVSAVREWRSADVDRYRDAYDSALDDAAIAGDARAERRATALADFDVWADQRRAHYDRVEALATAAVQSHTALVEAEGLILFDQGGNTGRRAGLGAGAYGRDSDAELLLSQVVDLLSATLDADGLGPREGANVRAWVWDGFLDAATN